MPLVAPARFIHSPGSSESSELVAAPCDVIDEAQRIALEARGPHDLVVASAALLLNATRLENVRAIAEAGELMPQKSTCFHPKLIDGFGLLRLDGERA